MRLRPSRGFTLVELLVTVIVFGIVLAVAVPNFQNYLVQNRVKTGAQALFADLIYTRSEAIKRNADVRIEPNGGNWEDGWVVMNQDQVTAGNDYADCQSNASNCLSIQEPLDGITVTTDDASVTYQSDGRLDAPANPPVSFAVCDDAQSAEITERQVTTSLTGRPSIEYNGAC